MTITDWIQAILMVMLIGVTIFYAWQTKKTVSEMREQRYAALRPLIDIVEHPLTGKEMMKQGFDAKEGKFPKDLPCRLRNIGVGPAIELYSFIEGAGGKPRRWDFGALPVAVGEEEMGYTRETQLLLEQRGDHRALVAYYKDVYGNPFESSREVSVDKDKEAVNIDALEIRPLPRKEHTE